MPFGLRHLVGEFHGLAKKFVKKPGVLKKIGRVTNHPLTRWVHNFFRGKPPSKEEIKQGEKLEKFERQERAQEEREGQVIEQQRGKMIGEIQTILKSQGIDLNALPEEDRNNLLQLIQASYDALVKMHGRPPPKLPFLSRAMAEATRMAIEKIVKWKGKRVNTKDLIKILKDEKGAETFKNIFLKIACDEIEKTGGGALKPAQINAILEKMQQQGQQSTST